MTCHLPAAPPDPYGPRETMPEGGIAPCRWTEIAREAFDGLLSGDHQPLQSLFDHIESASWN